ncbi:hypothetical protein BN136_2020 [Cronobacter universalis NCTC 9529]|nr:hypothetical protein BN136_2020 [Cronobacter universalis NCTC 9529]
MDFAHGLHHALDHLTALPGHLTRVARDVARKAGVFGVVFHNRRQLFHRRRGLFQRARLRFVARREFTAAGGDLRRCGSDGFGAVAHARHNAGQVDVHLLKRAHQLSGFIATADGNRRLQITGGDVAGDGYGLRQRTRNAAHQPEGDHNARDKRQRHRDKQHGAGLLILRQIACFRFAGQDIRLLQRFRHHFINHPGRLPVDAAHQLIDALGARRVGNVILRNRRQIAFFQILMQRKGLADFIHAHAKLRQERRQAVQQRLGFVTLIDKRGFVFIKRRLPLRAAQQGVFPLLYLDFELHLRVTRGVDALCYHLFRGHNIVILLKPVGVDHQAANADKEHRDKQ